MCNCVCIVTTLAAACVCDALGVATSYNSLSGSLHADSLQSKKFNIQLQLPVYKSLCAPSNLHCPPPVGNPSTVLITYSTEKTNES